MAKVNMMVHIPVSIMVGNSRALDEAAELVRARVVAEAAHHRLSGAFINSVKIERVRGRQGNGRLVTDRLVYSNDPGVMAIEYGRKRNTDPANTERIPGQFIFTKAFSKTGWS